LPVMRVSRTTNCKPFANEWGRRIIAWATARVLRIKIILNYIKAQSVPRSKHTPSRL
jgi:hypothetical protein